MALKGYLLYQRCLLFLFSSFTVEFVLLINLQFLECLFGLFRFGLFHQRFIS